MKAQQSIIVMAVKKQKIKVLYCHLSRDKPQTKNQRKIKLIGKLLLFPVPLSSDKPTCSIYVGYCGLNDNTIVYLSTRGVSIKKKIAQGTFIKVSEINSGNV